MSGTLSLDWQDFNFENYRREFNWQRRLSEAAKVMVIVSVLYGGSPINLSLRI